MNDLVGKNLSGWNVTVWYELYISNDKRLYFTDKDLAILYGRGKGEMGSDAKEVTEVLVLTNMYSDAYLINKSPIMLQNEKEIKAQAINAAKSKLTPEELKLLGHNA